MVETNEIIKILERVILEPGLSSAFWFFLFALLSEVIAPIPSTLVFAAPLVAISGSLDTALFVKLILFVAIPLAVGMTVGSYMIYGIAYFGGKPAIEKFKKYLRFSWEDVEKLESKFKNNWYDEVLFLILRLIPVVPNTPLNILAGLLRMNFVSYSILTTVGILVKVVIMIMIFGFGGNGIIDFFNL